VLQNVYGMTAAEIRLAMRMDQGLRLREAAEAERISYETARTRLKIVFGKLSIRRQAELIRMLNEIAASSAPNWELRPPGHGR
jgi:DNA-binding CsgD family transcriptional regulator